MKRFFLLSFSILHRSFFMKTQIMLIAVFLLFYIVSSGQTILNGSFENNTAGTNQINLPNASFTAMMANCTSFGTYGDLDIITTNAFTGSGTDMIAMKLSQPLIQGNSYTLTFYDRGCNPWIPYPFDIGVSLTDTNFGTTVLNGTQTPVVGVWTQRTVTFIAPNSGQYITVRMNGGGLGDWAHVDNFCLNCGSAPIAAFQSSDTVFCDEAGKCIDFFDHSSGNPTSWHWIFPGAIPDTSDLQNPTNICYYSTGTYAVTLIVSNSGGTDTLDVSPHIIFTIPPPPPVITVLGGDTLVSTYCFSYQWYRDGSLIAGATDSFYVATQGGTYSVQGADSLGCSGISNGILITGLSDITNGDESLVKLYPNPVSDELIISFNRKKTCEVLITDILGQQLITKTIYESKDIHAISVKELSNGIYFLQLRMGTKMINKRFVVAH